MRVIEPGTQLKLDIVPQAKHTAAAVGNHGIEVVATTALILFIEEACGTLAAPYYEQGEATVGVRVEVDHVAPAWVGTPIDVRAEFTGTRGRRLLFRNEIYQNDVLVMKGFHHRSVVAMRDFADSQPI
ncbi:MAG: hypothetical protein CMO26_09270 [Thiotrichales bacterium]|nr:hypothetical protein [Thiotrichales bacterium]